MRSWAPGFFPETWGVVRNNRSRQRGRGRAAALWIAGTVLLASPHAQADSDDGPKQKPQSRSPAVNAAQAIGADEIEGPTILEGLPILNGLDRARDTLRDTYGLYLYGNFVADPFANLDGGLGRGAAYAGRLDVNLDVNAEKTIGLAGGTLHANMFQISGLDISKAFVGNVLSINDIAARPTTRLYELWYQQTFGDALSVRIGQMGIDVEFLTSNYAANFINASFGWPGLPSIDLPQGGPAYPLATPAARIKIDPTENVSILAAVFDGLPAGPGPGDPQARDRYGVTFRTSDPPLVFVEAQLRYNRAKSGTEEAPSSSPVSLPGTVKLGAFAQFGGLAGQQLNTEGAAFVPANQRPNPGLYAIIDQQIYRVPGDDPQNGIGVFARVIAAPDDRNPIDVYADAGVSALGAIPGRPDDVFGIAGAFAAFSPAARAFDQRDNLEAGIAAPIRTFEAVIELTYSAQIIPGLAIQPTFQYIVHPGGGIANPTGNGTRPLRDAKVFGASTTIRF